MYKEVETTIAKKLLVHDKQTVLVLGINNTKEGCFGATEAAAISSRDDVGAANIFTHLPDTQVKIKMCSDKQRDQYKPQRPILSKTILLGQSKVNTTKATIRDKKRAKRSTAQERIRPKERCDK